jgi:2-polyprenyl-6-hydroxyphenyl methylase/3-demethylubiquinone-9 3-methyltransferase
MPALDKATKRPAKPRSDATVDTAEVERFAALAEEWWDPEGKFRPLHRLNPVRLAFIRDRLCARFGRDPTKPRPLAGLKVIDIGCGGGLVAEPLARLGAHVAAIDASERNIGVARTHAEGQGLAIDYRFATAADIVAAGETFDAVVSLEVIEHVADRAAFVKDCADLVAPGGLLILATLNRTAKAFALGIVGAEFILRWLPVGTHDWRKFVRPSELAADLRRAGMRLADLKGISYNPLSDRFSLSADIDVNYLAVAERA